MAEKNSINYPPSMSYSINHMWLTVEPDFDSRSIKGEEQLKLTARQDLTEIKLDCATEMKIDSVLFSLADHIDDTANNRIKLQHDPPQNDKLIIKLGEKTLTEGAKFHIIIKYHTTPSRGFYFIDAQERPYKRGQQAWTQGEAVDSKYWFPTFDHPEMKFPRQISVIVPERFTVISNGELDIRDLETNDGGKEKGKENKKKQYIWEEPSPNPAYLTSVVIGNFAETSKGINYKNRIPLSYYVPKEREQDAERTFKDTPKMMEFFETFFGTEYPYDKYAQVIIEDFPYGGMENTTCTTLELGLLHDERAHLDFSSDDTISHELAHHWFGDLVTCRDWEHIWLNEGFASYSEALYLESSQGEKEFLYYLIQMADVYLQDAMFNGKHALVTKEYKNPDALFDVGHTYKKGGLVVNMIRQYVGNNDFRKSLEVYLDRYRDKTAETDDIRQIFEEISGQSLQQFFDQWLFGSGHPELDIGFSQDSSDVILSVFQTQPDDKIFSFPLEIKLAITSSEGKLDIIKRTIEVSQRKTEIAFQIPIGGIVEWFSIDPDFKIVKDVKDVKAPVHFLLSKLMNRKDTTVIERIEAARNLRKITPDDSIIDTLKKAILEEDLSLDDTFWGVSLEAARTIGSMAPSNKIYDILIQCFASVNHPKTKTAIMKALRIFDNPELLGLFQKVLDDNNQSYNVQQQAAIGIGKMADGNTFNLLKRHLETESFQNLVEQGAITGLRIFGTRTTDREVITQIITLLIDKCGYSNYDNIRASAISALSFFISDKNGNIKNPGYDRVAELLHDRSVRVRNNACVALGRAFLYTKNPTVIAELKKVAEEDVDGQIRESANESMRLINKDREILEMIKSVPDKEQFISDKLHFMERRIADS